MNIVDKNIDAGKAFDFGKTSSDYAKYRDIYPQVFYDKIISRNLCVKGQSVLDIGTGTGVIPRNMYRYGAKWTGTDISENQIEYAKLLSKNMDIAYYASATESINFPDNSFDVITACQCFWYFNHEQVMPMLHRLLNDNGRILILYMTWLPFEDKIAGESEKLVLKYSPNWSGAGETVHPIDIPECYKEKFELVYNEEYKLSVPFTRESWNGRMKSCRGVGASLTQEELVEWECEHIELLERIAPNEFEVLHYAAISELKRSKVYAICEVICMNEFINKYQDFLSVFNKGKTMVLSSCEDNKVSSRMMSIVCIDGMFYFQTDMSFRKYRELIHNPQVALCIDNIQIEGVCKEIGHPMANAQFCSEYEKNFNTSFKMYSSLKNERLFKVSPTFVERWLYIDGVPFIETFDVENQVYKLTKYESE